MSFQRFSFCKYIIISGDETICPIFSHSHLVALKVSNYNLRYIVMAVLVVDDDNMTRTLHTLLVKRQKFDVHVAENGKEAVTKATAGHYELILMDMEMPVMDGLQATKVLRNSGLTCPIIGVTSREERADIQAFIEAGANKCLAKPLNMEKLKPLLEGIASSVASISGAK